MTDHVHDDCLQCLQREVRDLKKKLGVAEETLLHLKTCSVPECDRCGALLCPHGDMGHFWADGCPSCVMAAREQEEKTACSSTVEHGPPERSGPADGGSSPSTPANILEIVACAVHPTKVSHAVFNGEPRCLTCMIDVQRRAGWRRGFP